MILNISFRTDVVACYPFWLAHRLLACEEIGSRNPYYPNKVSLYKLNAVDKIVFCSKDYREFLYWVDSINQKYDCLYNYTITPYNKDIEPHVPNWQDSIITLKKLSDIVGPNKIVWRFDPIFLTDTYTKEYIIGTFNVMAKELAPYIKMCTFSFVTPYGKTLNNCPEIKELKPEDELYIVKSMADIANANNIYLQTCRAKPIYKDWGVHIEGCLTPRSLELNVKPDPKAALLKGCACTVKTYGIGDYDTCSNGCKYCYAVNNHSNLTKVDNHLSSPLMNGFIRDSDEVKVYNEHIVQELDLFGYESLVK